MDLGNLMKQAQKMQKDMAKVEKLLAETEYSGEAQAVKCTINGNMELVKMDIEDDALEDKEMLIDMITIAFNSASKKAQADRDAKLGGITGGMRIPGM